MSWYPQGRGGPCMCGAIDCRSCGPAQGYSLDPDPREDEEREDEEREFEPQNDVQAAYGGLVQTPQG